MNESDWALQVTAPAAIIAGLLTCFWGYRILKLTLGIVGFIVGAAAGSAIASSVATGHSGIALACAIIGGILGAILCIWLFFLGVFLLGASAGTVVAAALFGGIGHNIQPIFLLVFAVVFGLLALLLQKFMIVISTAFGGAYLVTAGALHLVTAGPNLSPLWFDRLPTGSAGISSYVALVFWAVLGVLGARVQYRGIRRKPEPPRQEPQPA